MSAPALLYKYAGPERVDALRERRVRFSQPSALNDPFEGSVLVDALLREDGFDALVDDVVAEAEAPGRSGGVLDDIAGQAAALSAGHLGALGLDAEAGAALLRPFAEHVLAETKRTGALRRHLVAKLREQFVVGDDIMREALALVYQERLDAHVGVLCLSEAWDVGLMWAHYAGAHSGFVLGFDADDRFFHQPYVSPVPHHVRAVTYGEAPPRYGGFDTRGDAEGEVHGLFEPLFHKGRDWAYEREWRLLRPLGAALQEDRIDAAPFPVHLFGWPEHALREVVLGARASQETEGAVRDVLDRDHYDHVSLYRQTHDRTSGTIGRRLVRSPSADPFWGDRVRGNHAEALTPPPPP